MRDEFIVKPSAYDIGENGENVDNYSFENLKEDVISLDGLSKQQLVLECANRWRNFSEAPLPSRYRKYRAAYDLANTQPEL